MNEREETPSDGAGQGSVARAVPIFLMALALEGLAYGWTCTVLWGWFIVPLGAPFLRPAHILGLALLTRMVPLSTSLRDAQAADWGLEWAWRLGWCAFTLACLWVVHLFM